MKTKKITLFFLSMLFCTFMVFGQSFKGSAETSESITKVSSTVNEKVYDIDGNEYNTVTIGTQTWLLENLRTTKYRNGDPIGTTATPDEDYSAEANPKYQWVYRGNESNLANYGRLYTWYAATDPRQIAPVGYRVPTDQDLIDLATYLIENGDLYSFDGLKNTGTVDGGNKIPKALASTTFWQTEAAAGTPGYDKASNNASGFSLIPAGHRKDGFVPAWTWDYLNRGAYIWTSTGTLTDPNKAIARWMFYNTTSFNTRPNGESKKFGMSIRCIKGEAPSSVDYVKDDILNFQMYPRQVKDHATISFATILTEKVSLDIYSIEGKLVYQNEYNSIGGLDKISVQLSHLNQGIYLCRVNSANTFSVVKFTKI